MITPDAEPADAAFTQQLTASGAVWWRDDFEQYAQGPLAGNGWTASGPGADIVARSSRMMRINPPEGSGATVVLGKDVPDQSSGRHLLSFEVRIDNSTVPSVAKLEVQRAATQYDKKFQVYFGSSIRVNYGPNGEDAVIVQRATMSQRWYHITCALDLDTELLDVFVDDQLRATGISMAPGPIVKIGASGWDRPGGGAVYLDTIVGVAC